MKRTSFLLLLLLCRTAFAQTLSPATTTKLNALADDVRLADARIGISVLAIGKAVNSQAFPSQAFAAPKELFARDADKRFTPASNMKLYTAALALKVLGPQRKFTTRVRATGALKNGVLRGHLRLEGAGDPAFDFADLNELVKQVKASGIRRVEQAVPIQVLEGKYSTGGIAENFFGLYPDGWTLDDARWYYGPEITLLALHRNQMDVTMTGGAKAGAPPTTTLEKGVGGVTLDANSLSDEAPEIIVDAQVKTEETAIAKGDAEDSLQVERVIAAEGEVNIQVIEINGSVAPKQKVTVGLAIPSVQTWAAQVFTNELRAAGVQIHRTQYNAPATQSASSRIVATHDSPPVGILLHKFLKDSDNLYGELLLRLAARADLSQKKKSLNTNLAQQAHGLLREYLKSEKINDASLRFSDGSGLSRYNLVTPRATSELLAAAERLPGAQFFWDALPIAGVDGTLKKRMIGTSAQNNVRAKTGTFSITSCLSGYVTTRDGTRCAVSVLTNFAKGGDARAVQNEIFAAIADATLAND